MTRRLLAVVVGLLLLCVATYAYPLGGSVWSAKEVTALAVTRLDQRVALTDSRYVAGAADEAVLAARIDRFRRWFPGQSCQSVALELRTGAGWVRAPLCEIGFLWDDIPREAWQPAWP